MADVYVQDGRQKKIRDGHPWIYRNEIAAWRATRPTAAPCARWMRTVGCWATAFTTAGP